VPAPRPHDDRDSATYIKATLRRQPVCIVDGHFQGGYTDEYEIVCLTCGDHLDLDYSEVALWLQVLRGPYPLEAGLAAYHEHLGIPGSTRPGPG